MNILKSAAVAKNLLFFLLFCPVTALCNPRKPPIYAIAREAAKIVFGGAAAEPQEEQFLDGTNTD